MKDSMAVVSRLQIYTLFNMVVHVGIIHMISLGILAVRLLIGLVLFHGDLAYLQVVLFKSHFKVFVQKKKNFFRNKITL